jgi:hypothetical protein
MSSSFCLITIAADILPVLESSNAIALDDISGTNGIVDGFSVTDIASLNLLAVDVNWDG